MAELIWSDETCEIWLGNCLDASDVAEVMGDRKADLLNVDAPYSEKTHAGHDGGVRQINGFTPKPGTPEYQRTYAEKHQGAKRKNLEYNHWTPGDVSEFCELWNPVTRGWFASTTDNVLSVAWLEELEKFGRYTFAPLAWVETGSRVRLVGDGPSNWGAWLVVARPRKPPYSKWGTRRGAYVMPAENHQCRPDRVTGAKAISGTIQLIEDYSKPGELVVDPALGGGTTMIAARMCGRRCIGMEMDRERAELCARLMRDGARSKVAPNQERLFG